ncbi:MAG: hypothetical protein LBS53_05230 [Synergistaceae bacterium]|jgi:hypothetical protein|nr:hypothetical protein [Synergistaceae bacterium]
MRALLLLLLALVAIGLITPNPIMADEIVQYTVGPIWDDDEARLKCESVAGRVAQQYPGHTVSWDDRWETVVEGESSICYYNIED